MLTLRTSVNAIGVLEEPVRLGLLLGCPIALEVGELPVCLSAWQSIAHGGRIGARIAGPLPVLVMYPTR